MATETPTPTQSYSEQWYWDERYTNESEPFDWYQKYSSLAPLINLYVPHRNQRVLIVGCGNSGLQIKKNSFRFFWIRFDFSCFEIFNAAFSQGMVDDGYEDVVSIDISSVVIDTMIKKYSDRPQLKCNVLISSALCCNLPLVFMFLCLS